MVVTYHVSFYEPWQGALMNGSFERYEKNYEEAQKSRENYVNYYSKKYGNTATVTMTVKE